MAQDTYGNTTWGMQGSRQRGRSWGGGQDLGRGEGGFRGGSQQPPQTVITPGTPTVGPPDGSIPPDGGGQSPPVVPQSVSTSRTPGQITSELNGTVPLAPTAAQVAANPAIWAGSSFDPQRTIWGAQGPPATGGANSLPQGSENVGGVGIYTGANAPLDLTRFTPVQAPAPSGPPAGSVATRAAGNYITPTGASWQEQGAGRQPNEDYYAYMDRVYGANSRLDPANYNNKNRGGYNVQDTPVYFND